MFDFTWILPSLCFHVLIKILVMCIRIVTFVALICSPPRICLQNNEDHHSLKTFATLTALIHGFFQGHVITSCKTSILSKTLLHCLHWYSSPNGVLPCGLLRIICYEYAMSHGLHLYDFSPECVFEKHFMVINLSKKHCYFEYIDIVSPQFVYVVL